MVWLFEKGSRDSLTIVNKHNVEVRIPDLNNDQNRNIHMTYIDENKGQACVGHCLIQNPLA